MPVVTSCVITAEPVNINTIPIIYSDGIIFNMKKQVANEFICHLEKANTIFEAFGINFGAYK